MELSKKYLDLVNQAKKRIKEISIEDTINYDEKQRIQLS